MHRVMLQSRPEFLAVRPKINYLIYTERDNSIESIRESEKVITADRESRSIAKGIRLPSSVESFNAISLLKLN